MPALGSGNKPEHVERAQRKKRVRVRPAPRPTPAPQTRRPDLASPGPSSRARKQPQQASSHVVNRAGDSPATRKQDFKRAEQARNNRGYQHSIRKAYRSRSLADRQHRLAGIEAKGRRGIRLSPEDKAVWKRHQWSIKQLRKSMNSPAADDREMNIADRYKRTDAYRKTLDEVHKAAEESRKRAARDIDYVHESDPAKLRAAGFSEDPLEKIAQAPAKHIIKPVAEKGSQGALKALEQTTRPLHAVAAAAKSDIKEIKEKGFIGALGGGEGRKAAGRGFTLKDKSTFSDVLAEAGWKPKGALGKIARGAAGFGLDVAADPLTYATFGTGSAAAHAAERAAAATATTRTVTKKEAARAASRAHGGGASTPSLAERAAAHAAKKAPAGSGITVRYAGKEIPGVRRATAAAARAARKARHPDLDPVAASLRKAGNEVNPNIRAAGISREEHDTIRQIGRTARSKVARGRERARAEGHAVQKAIGEENYLRVLDAIEAGKIGDLPPELFKAARFLRSRYRYIRRMEKQAGIKGGTRKNYVPHVATDLLEDKKAIGVASVGRRVIRPASSKVRRDQRTLAEIRHEEPGSYVEDPGALLAARMTEGSRSLAQAQLNRRLADLGRRVRPGVAVELHPGEEIYHIVGSDIKQLDRRARANFVDGKAPKRGQYVALNRTAVDRALKTITAPAERAEPAVWFDKVQGAWKFTATQPNPGFHVRNVIGDTWNAYLNQSLPRLARSAGQSAQGLRALSKRERAVQGLTEPRKGVLGRVLDPDKRGIKIDGVRVSYDDIAKEAENVGAVRTGFLGRELDDLLHGAHTPHKSSHVNRWLRNREDWMRLATYIGGRKKGLSPEEASALAAKHHFDYGELSEFERRTLRRLMPFYTFSSRNIPLQARTIVQKPGKYANLEKLRQEAAKAQGMPDDWQEGLPEWQQKGMPIPVKIGGQTALISAGASGLPAADLAELPFVGSGGPDEWLARGVSMTTPIIRLPLEVWANYSTFFREQIERENSPLTPISPAVVASIPGPLRSKFGIVDDYVDKRTGKKMWAAPAKVVYALNQLAVGPFGFAARATSPTAPDRSPAQQVSAFMGIRADNPDYEGEARRRLYDQREAVNKRLASLRQRGVNADKPSREYTSLLKQARDLTHKIEPPKATKAKGYGFGGVASSPSGFGFNGTSTKKEKSYGF